MKTVPRRALASFAGILVASFAAAQPDPSFLNWAVRGAPSAVSNTLTYPLENLANQEFLVYGSRTFGINLEWATGSEKSRVMFQLPNPGSTERVSGNVKFGDTIAIYIVGGGYLKYESRSVGVNLGWSKTPIYEWCLIGLAEKGSFVKSKMTLGLLNLRAKDFLVYQNRSVGINLGWRKSAGPPYAEGRRFMKSLRDRGFQNMAEFLRPYF